MLYWILCIFEILPDYYIEVGNCQVTIFEKYENGFWEKKEKNRGNKWKMNRRGTS